jgi:hypothetical protein
MTLHSTPMMTRATPERPPVAIAGEKAAYLAVKPEVSGMPAKASSRKPKTPATTGWLRPSPAHWDRCEASEPPWRTIETTAKAEMVAKP